MNNFKSLLFSSARYTHVKVHRLNARYNIVLVEKTLVRLQRNYSCYQNQTYVQSSLYS